MRLVQPLLLLLAGGAPSHSYTCPPAPAPVQGNLVPLYERVMADQLTPVLAYRCLVKEDDREAPSFLFESVTNGTQQVRAAPRAGVAAAALEATALEWGGEPLSQGACAAARSSERRSLTVAAPQCINAGPLQLCGRHASA